MAKNFVEMTLPKQADGTTEEEGEEGNGGNGDAVVEEKPVPSARTNPLHALRIAQAKAFNGEPFVLEAVCNAKMGQRIGSEVAES